MGKSSPDQQTNLPLQQSHEVSEMTIFHVLPKRKQIKAAGGLEVNDEWDVLIGWLMHKKVNVLLGVR